MNPIWRRRGQVTPRAIPARDKPSSVPGGDPAILSTNAAKVRFEVCDHNNGSQMDQIRGARDPPHLCSSYSCILFQLCSFIRGRFRTPSSQVCALLCFAVLRAAVFWDGLREQGPLSLLCVCICFCFYFCFCFYLRLCPYSFPLQRTFAFAAPLVSLLLLLMNMRLLLPLMLSLPLLL